MSSFFTKEKNGGKAIAPTLSTLKKKSKNSTISLKPVTSNKHSYNIDMRQEACKKILYSHHVSLFKIDGVGGILLTALASTQGRRGHVPSQSA
jgi:hypothetical protein